MRSNVWVIFGWALLLCGVIVCLFSIFASAMTTRVAVMLIGTLLFMFGDVILLINAAIKGD